VISRDFVGWWQGTNHCHSPGCLLNERVGKKPTQDAGCPILRGKSLSRRGGMKEGKPHLGGSLLILPVVARYAEEADRAG